ncbi:type II secretion system F family protein [Isoptericola sp. NPDC055881]
MTPVTLVAVGALSVSVGLLAWLVLDPARHDRRRVVANLRRGLDPAASSAASDPAGTTRPGAPAGLHRLVQLVTPPGAARRLDRLLSRAGRPPGWPLQRLLGAKVVLAGVAGGAGLLYADAVDGALPVLLALVVTVGAYFLPELLLHSRGQERARTIGTELADTLDQMTIAVEAGLGFEAAMARAGETGKGPLAEELVRTLQDVRMGLARRQAYEALAQRADVPDLRRFVRAVIQADAYGIAIADVLRTQAAEMRLKRRQRAEEKAMQIPVKVVFPLMLCILPVLFIVLLGPAVLTAMQTFS